MNMNGKTHYLGRRVDEVTGAVIEMWGDADQDPIVADLHETGVYSSGQNTRRLQALSGIRPGYTLPSAEEYNTDPVETDYRHPIFQKQALDELRGRQQRSAAIRDFFKSDATAFGGYDEAMELGVPGQGYGHLSQVRFSNPPPGWMSKVEAEDAQRSWSRTPVGGGHDLAPGLTAMDAATSDFTPTLAVKHTGQTGVRAAFASYAGTMAPSDYGGQRLPGVNTAQAPVTEDSFGRMGTEAHGVVASEFRAPVAPTQQLRDDATDLRTALRGNWDVQVPSYAAPSTEVVSQDEAASWLSRAAGTTDAHAFASTHHRIGAVDARAPLVDEVQPGHALRGDMRGVVQDSAFHRMGDLAPVRREEMAPTAVRGTQLDAWGARMLAPPSTALVPLGSDVAFQSRAGAADVHGMVDTSFRTPARQGLVTADEMADAGRGTGTQWDVQVGTHRAGDMSQVTREEVQAGRGVGTDMYALDTGRLAVPEADVRVTGDDMGGLSALRTTAWGADTMPTLRSGALDRVVTDEGADLRSRLTTSAGAFTDMPTHRTAAAFEAVPADYNLQFTPLRADSAFQYAPTMTRMHVESALDEARREVAEAATLQSATRPMAFSMDEVLPLHPDGINFSRDMVPIDTEPTVDTTVQLAPERNCTDFEALRYFTEGGAGGGAVLGELGDAVYSTYGTRAPTPGGYTSEYDEDA